MDKRVLLKSAEARLEVIGSLIVPIMSTIAPIMSTFVKYCANPCDTPR